jgi:hypothetical protein
VVSQSAANAGTARTVPASSAMNRWRDFIAYSPP